MCSHPLELGGGSACLRPRARSGMYALFIRTSASHLVIALPHSSSTSTGSSLATMASLHSYQDLVVCNRAGQPFAENETFGALGRYHHDVCSLPSATLHRWALHRDIIFKQHLVPMAHHLESLERACARVVVLLRRPVMAARAACERAALDRQKADYPRHRPVRHGEVFSMFHHYCDDLVAWTDGWRRIALERPAQFLLVTYEQLQGLEGRAAGLARILAFLGLEPKRPFVNFKRYLVNRTSQYCAAQATPAARGDAEWARHHANDTGVHRREVEMSSPPTVAKCTARKKERNTDTSEM